MREIILVNRAAADENHANSVPIASACAADAPLFLPPRDVILDFNFEPNDFFHTDCKKRSHLVHLL